MSRFGFRSPATVASHLDLMEKKGSSAVRRVRSRNIVLSDFKPRPELQEIPLYGMIPAGIPEGQEQDSEKRCRLIRGWSGCPGTPGPSPSR